MRRALVFAVLVCLLPWAAAAQQPPADLHLVGDHWTAWDPPAVPEGTQVYVIQPGDTLWDLAARLLKDPYQWPQLWEQNQYILDAHWLYPGDPLVLTGIATVAPADEVAGPPLEEAVPTAEDVLALVEEEARKPFDTLRAIEAPVALGFESDIYCTGFIGDLEEEFPYAIAGSEYEFLNPTLDPARESEIKGLWGKTDTQKYGLSVGDILYLDGGRADGLSAGILLTAVEPQDKIIHPLTNELIGRFYHYMGRVRVLSAQEETAIAEIISACDPVPVGTRLQLFEPEPVPLRRITPMRPINYPAAPEELEAGPTIIASRDNLVALASGHLVFIDQGAAHDVAPGDIYTIYRRGRRGFPPIVLGELGVLSVFENASLGRILRHRHTVYVGDVLVIK